MGTYLYLFDAVSSDGKRRFWRRRHNQNECKARVHTSIDDIEIIKTINKLNHDSEAVI